MSEQITIVVYASTGYVGCTRTEEITIDKDDYENSENKEAFLQEIHDDYIGNVVETGVYIKEE